MVHIPADILVRFLSYVALLKLAVAKETGLNAFQLLTLMLVGASSAISIKELKGKLSIPGSSLTFTIDSLEKKGLLRRQRSKKDRRQWLLSLSARGERFHAQVVKTENGMISPALDKLSDPERQTFLKIAEAILRTKAEEVLELNCNGAGI